MAVFVSVWFKNSVEFQFLTKLKYKKSITPRAPRSSVSQISLRVVQDVTKNYLHKLVNSNKPLSQD